MLDSEERFIRLARYSGIPAITSGTHLLMKFIPLKGSELAYQSAIDFIAFEDGMPKRKHFFITFVGEPGRGKTHLALGIGWQWLTQDMGMVIYWQVSELLDAMRDEFDHPPQTEGGTPLKGAFERCKEASLLILDDLGVEKSTEWAVDKLDTLINYRYLESKPTVFTTNLTPGQLQKRIHSRLKEGIVVTLGCPDYRLIKARR